MKKRHDEFWRYLKATLRVCETQLEKMGVGVKERTEWEREGFSFVVPKTVLLATNSPGTLPLGSQI